MDKEFSIQDENMWWECTVCKNKYKTITKTNKGWPACNKCENDLKLVKLLGTKKDI